MAPRDAWMVMRGAFFAVFGDSVNAFVQQAICWHQRMQSGTSRRSRACKAWDWLVTGYGDDAGAGCHQHYPLQYLPLGWKVWGLQLSTTRCVCQEHSILWWTNFGQTMEWPTLRVQTRPDGSVHQRPKLIACLPNQSGHTGSSFFGSWDLFSIQCSSHSDWVWATRRSSKPGAFSFLPGGR